jgi:hypothetical protein
MAYSNPLASALVTSSGTGSVDVSYPVGVASGDIMVLVGYSNLSSIGIQPGGGGSTWSALGTAGSGLYVWWARHDGSIDATVPLGGDSDSGDPDYIPNDMAGRMFSWTGGIAAGSPVDVGGTVTTESTGATITGDAISTGVDNALLAMILFYQVNKTIGSVGGGIDAYFTGGNNASGCILCGYKLDTGSLGSKSAPTITWSSGTSPAYSLTFSLKPVAGAAGATNKGFMLLGVGGP